LKFFIYNAKSDVILGLTSQDEHRPNKRVPVQGAPVRKDLSGKIIT
jgi:hypothetical protein